MRKLPKGQIIFLYIFSILCLLIRLVCLGWTLMFFFWIIIPFYVIHLWGQFKTYQRVDLNRKDIYLIYASSILLTILTVIQHDCADNRCYYAIDLIYHVFTHEYFMPEPKEEFFSNSTIVLYIVDALINLYLLISPIIKRKKVLKNCFKENSDRS
jgi:hypothetical protein